MNDSIRKTIEKRHQNLAQERKRIVDLQKLEQESRFSAEKEYTDFIQSKQNAKTTKQKRQELEKEVYNLQNMLESLRKNRAVVEDQNAKLEKLKIEREQQIMVMNEKINDKELEVSKAEKCLQDAEATLKDIIESALQ